MIISLEKRFVFIKTMKTAGSSIEVYLAKQALGDTIVTPQFPEELGYVDKNSDGFFDHCLAARVRDWMGKKSWNSYYSFCVERDPWEKVLSLYSMHKSRQITKITESLDAWLEQKIFPLNYPIYTDLHRPEKIIVSRVLKYENLPSELSEVFSELNIPFNGSLGVNAKGGYRKDRGPAREVLTPQQYNMIGDAFAHEIKILGWY